MVEQRLTRLRQEMEKRDIPAFLVTSAVNRAYLSGFVGTAGTLLVVPDEAVLFVDFRYTEQAMAQAPECRVVEHGLDVKKDILAYLQSRDIRAIGFEERHVTYGAYAEYAKAWEGVELLPIDGLPEELRQIKDDRELEVMREAAELADAAYLHVLDVIRPGMRETEVALELEWFMRKRGATGASFETIVASGERSALPHGTASERELRANEFVTMDFGAYYKGYCSDLTRTIVLGKADDRHKEIYGIVLEAQMYALEHIRPGMTGREADALARGMIEKYGYGDRFGHSTGHGLGMEIHEAPRLSKLSETVLVPGMVVTVEPGIYIPGFGGVRIEDDVVITESGAERLTRSSKDLVELN